MASRDSESDPPGAAGSEILEALEWYPTIACLQEEVLQEVQEAPRAHKEQHDQKVQEAPHHPTCQEVQ